jgi:hypothetical protein
MNDTAAPAGSPTNRDAQSAAKNIMEKNFFMIKKISGCCFEV